MSVRECKFCGCSERRACQLIAVRTWNKTASDVDPLILQLGAALVLVPADAQTSIIPCSWLLPDVCTNPLCVEKAYAEAREMEFVEAVQGLLDLGLVEISDDGEEQLLLTEEGRFEADRLRRTA